MDIIPERSAGIDISKRGAKVAIRAPGANTRARSRRLGCFGDFGRWALLRWGVLPESEFMSMTASRRRFSQEFKDGLCQEVISTSKTIKDVAVAYGVGPETLRTWLIKYR
jgi:hypothetical protein